MKLLTLVLLFATSLAFAKAKYPAEVLLLIDRAQDCNHFAGEDPYDDERAIEIAKAMRQLKCRSLEKDKERLIKKYKGNGEIVKAIEFTE